MNMGDIEIASFDNLLVYKKGYTPEFVSKIITDKKLGGLRIFSILKEDKLETINFLQDYSFLEKLDVTSSTDFDFSFLSRLVNLKKLSINVEGRNEIDLSSLTKLEYLSVQWRKTIKGFENCTRLSSLGLIELKEPDLVKISSVKSLTDIRIKTASIESLNGLQGLINLQSLSIGNCKKLTSINAINQLPKLRNLYFEKCPIIKDYESVNSLPSLEDFSLIDCGVIESIKFTESFPLLSKLSLLGNTIVNDGNLLPAKRIKSVEHKHYKHYNIKIEDTTYNQTVKNNLQKIKNLFK
jgi:hypothetical protein